MSDFWVHIPFEFQQILNIDEHLLQIFVFTTKGAHDIRKSYSIGIDTSLNIIWGEM